MINVDLPWNPAVLEQRVARAHRMGQKQPVQVYVLVTEGTIEEGLLATLSAKHDLALAALDPDSDVKQVDFKSGIEELRRRLEVLLGAKPEAPLDVTKREEADGKTDGQIEQLAEQRDRVAAAGGEMLGAVFSFLGELVSQDQTQPPDDPLVAQVRNRLNECVEEDSSGRQRLTVTLPDRRAGRPRPDPGPAHVGRRQGFVSTAPRCLTGCYLATRIHLGGLHWHPSRFLPRRFTGRILAGRPPPCLILGEGVNRLL